MEKGNTRTRGKENTESRASKSRKCHRNTYRIREHALERNKPRERSEKKENLIKACIIRMRGMVDGVVACDRERTTEERGSNVQPKKD